MVPILGAVKAWSLGLKLGILALTIFSLLGTGFWIGSKWTSRSFEAYKTQVAQEKLAQQTALLRAIEEANARTAVVESAAQEAIARLKTRVRTITREVVREVEKPVYLECVIPDTGRVLLDDAVREANTAVKSSDPVP